METVRRICGPPDSLLYFISLMLIFLLALLM